MDPLLSNIRPLEVNFSHPIPAAGHRYIASSVNKWHKQAAQSEFNKRKQQHRADSQFYGQRLRVFTHHSIRLPVGDRRNWFHRSSLSQQVTAHQMHTYICLGGETKTKLHSICITFCPRMTAWSFCGLVDLWTTWDVFADDVCSLSCPGHAGVDQNVVF